MQTALDWHIEGVYARYIDASGKCRAMVRLEAEPDPPRPWARSIVPDFKEARA